MRIGLACTAPISRISSAARAIPLESIAKLARALELSLSVLFGRTACPDAEGGAVVEILLVEDEPRDVELTMRAFERARLSNPIHVLRDGAAALDFIFATGPHAHRRAAGGPMVVLLDLNLPVIGGLEVLRRMKADKRTREIPVVILTLSNRDRDMAECRRLGAVNYIVKPVGFQNFSEVIPGLEDGMGAAQNHGRDGRRKDAAMSG